MLAELTSLAAVIEAISARTTYRFGASRAYYGMVRQRLEQLRQQRIEGLQTSAWASPSPSWSALPGSD